MMRTECFVAYTLVPVHHDYDICLLKLLKCIAVYDSLTKSKKSATMKPILSVFRYGLSFFEHLRTIIIYYFLNPSN